MGSVSKAVSLDTNDEGKKWPLQSAAKEISADAAIVAVLSEPDVIFTLEEAAAASRRGFFFTIKKMSVEKY